VCVCMYVCMYVCMCCMYVLPLFTTNVHAKRRSSGSNGNQNERRR